MKTPIRIAAATFAATLALSGCGALAPKTTTAEPGAQASTPAPRTSTPARTTPSPTPSPTPKLTPGAVTPIGLNGTDPSLADKIEILQLMRGYEVPAKQAEYIKNGELVFLEVRATLGGKFQTGISSSDFTLNSRTKSFRPASMTDAEKSTVMEPLKLTLFQPPSNRFVIAGKANLEPAQGWIPYIIEPAGLESIEIKYTRAAFKESSTQAEHAAWTINKRIGE